jgi:transcription elongation factor Elf1
MTFRQIQVRYYECPVCNAREPFDGYPTRSKIDCKKCGFPFTGSFNVYTKHAR